MAKKFLSLFVIAAFLLESIIPRSVFAQVSLKLPTIIPGNQGVSLDKFRPSHLRYFSSDKGNDRFKVILDQGDSKNLDNAAIEKVTRKLLEYFLVGVSLPDEIFWVNLRPDAEDRIIDPDLEKTDVGKIMLEADLQLKKDIATCTSTQTKEGREYWDKLYKRTEELYGKSPAKIPTLTRPWIVPGEIIVEESKDSVYVFKALLKVMLEQDYLKGATVYGFQDQRAKELNEYSSQLIRELIIPKLTQEVNSSKKYASLRQVYYSLILSRWFKLRFRGKTGTYSSLIDTKDLNGLTSVQAWSKTDYFDQYLKSFAKGEYNINETVVTPNGQVIRNYFSGGIIMDPKPSGFTSEEIPDVLLKRTETILLRGSAFGAGVGQLEVAAGADGGMLDGFKRDKTEEIKKHLMAGFASFNFSPAASIEEFSRVIELSPKHSASYLNRAESYLAIKKFDLALSDYSNAIAIGAGYILTLEDHGWQNSYYDPRPKAHLGRGNVFYTLKNYKEAAAEFTQAIDLYEKITVASPKTEQNFYNKNLAEAYYGRGRSYKWLGLENEGNVDLKKAYGLNPALSWLDFESFFEANKDKKADGGTGVSPIMMVLRTGYSEKSFSPEGVFSQEDFLRIENWVDLVGFPLEKLVLEPDWGWDPDSDHWLEGSVLVKLVFKGSVPENVRTLEISENGFRVFGSLGMNGAWPDRDNISDVKEYMYHSNPSRAVSDPRPRMSQIGEFRKALAKADKNDGGVDLTKVKALPVVCKVAYGDDWVPPGGIEYMFTENDLEKIEEWIEFSGKDIGGIEVYTDWERDMDSERVYELDSTIYLVDHKGKLGVEIGRSSSRALLDGPPDDGAIIFRPDNVIYDYKKDGGKEQEKAVKFQTEQKGLARCRLTGGYEEFLRERAVPNIKDTKGQTDSEYKRACVDGMMTLAGRAKDDGSELEELLKSVNDFRELSEIDFKAAYKNENRDEFLRCGSLVLLPTRGTLSVLGDTHGDVNSTQSILKPIESRMERGENVFLIVLGDYINNGLRSVDNLIYLLRLQKQYPGRVLLLSGNHEFGEPFETVFNEMLSTHWENARKADWPLEKLQRREQYGHLRSDLGMRYGWSEGEKLHDAFVEWGKTLPLAAINPQQGLYLSHWIGLPLRYLNGTDTLIFEDLSKAKANPEDRKKLEEEGYEVWRKSDLLLASLLNSRNWLEKDEKLIPPLVTQMIQAAGFPIKNFVLGHTHYLSGTTKPLADSLAAFICSSHKDSPAAGQYMDNEMSKKAGSYPCFAEIDLSDKNLDLTRVFREVKLDGEVNAGWSAKEKQIAPYKDSKKQDGGVENKPGGIDLRRLPLSVQTMGNFSGLNFSLSPMAADTLLKINIRAEVSKIKNMVTSGIVPSGERMKELISVSIQKGDFKAYENDLLLCVADILKLEQDSALESSPAMKESLAIINLLS